MSHDAVEFVLKAVAMVAEHGWKLLTQVQKKEKHCGNRKICEDVNVCGTCIYPIFLSRRFHRPIYFQFEFISNSDPHRNLSDQLQSSARANVDMSIFSREAALFYPYRSRSVLM